MTRPDERFEPRTGQVAALTHDGRGIVRTEGPTVFVDGALPGERIRYRQLRRRRNFVEAELEEILEPSAHRVAPRCRYFGVCGGCALQHLAAPEQRRLKHQTLIEALERIGGVAPQRQLEPLGEASWNYRRRARLAVRDVAAKGRVLVGFRERRMPYVADMLRCEILASPLDALIGPLSELIGGLSIRRRVPQIEVARGDDRTALVFRVLEEPREADLSRLRSFGERHSVDIYLQPGGRDSLRPLDAAAPLHYALPEQGIEFEFGPTDFLQIHGGLNRLLVDRTLALLDLRPQDRVLDLYCGLGNFSLPLARRAAGVVGVEGDATLVERARLNARRNHISNVEFHVANLTGDWRGLPWARRGYDAVLLDPPRAGAAEFLEHVQHLAARRILYVSCNPATLARDAAQLVRRHGYDLAATGILDMFPHTAHVESMALFERPARGGQHR